MKRKKLKKMKFHKRLKRMKFRAILKNRILKKRILRRLVTRFALKFLVISCLRVSPVHAIGGEGVDKIIVSAAHWLHFGLFHGYKACHETVQNIEDIALFSVMLLEEIVLKSDIGLTVSSILVAEQMNYLAQRQKYTYYVLLMAAYGDLFPQTVPTNNDTLLQFLPGFIPSGYIKPL